jgi:hypothetical protein
LILLIDGKADERYDILLSIDKIVYKLNRMSGESIELPPLTQGIHTIEVNSMKPLKIYFRINGDVAAFIVNRKKGVAVSVRSE